MAYKTFLMSFGLLVAGVGGVRAQPMQAMPASSLPAATGASPLAITPEVAAAYGQPSNLAYPVQPGPYGNPNYPGYPVQPAAFQPPPGYPGDPGAQGNPNYPGYPGDPSAFGYPVGPPQSPGLDYYGTVKPPPPANESTFFIGADFLLWWIKAAPTLPLIASSTDPADRAVLGNPTTTLRFATQDEQFGHFDGIRAHINTWVTDNFGLEAVGTIFESRSKLFSLRSDATGSPSIGVIFVDPNTQLIDSALVASAMAQSGGVDIRQTMRMYGFEGNFLLQGSDEGNLHLRTLIGFRHANMRETLDLAINTTFLADGIGSFNGKNFGDVIDDLWIGNCFVTTLTVEHGYRHTP